MDSISDRSEKVSKLATAANAPELSRQAWQLADSSPPANTAAPAPGTGQESKFDGKSVCLDLMAQTTLHQHQLDDKDKKLEFALRWHYVCTTDPRVDTPAGMDAVARDMVGSFKEKFDSYHDVDYTKRLKDQSQGVEVGIGIQAQIFHSQDIRTVNPFSEVISTEHWLTVRSVAPQGPAAVAGLKPFDRISSINGATVNGLDLSTALFKYTGTDGAPVDLEVLRQDSAGKLRTLQFHLTEKPVREDSAQYESLGDQVGYVKLSNFMDANAPKQMADALRKASSDKGLVLDLRSNVGGNLEFSKRIAEMLMESGDVYDTRPSEGDPGHITKNILQSSGWTSDTITNGTHSTVSDARQYQTIVRKGVPVVVLMDGMTASAAEIIAGALKTNRQATLIGEPSVGKNSIQDVLNLAGNRSAVVTSAEFLPGGVPLPASGLQPDKVVHQGTASDTQKAAAKAEVLRQLHHSKSMKPVSIKS